MKRINIISSLICLFFIFSIENSVASEMTNAELHILSGLLYPFQNKFLNKENNFERNKIKLGSENRELNHYGINNMRSNRQNKHLYWLDGNDGDETEDQISTEKRSAYRNFSKSFYINLLHKLNRAG